MSESSIEAIKVPLFEPIKPIEHPPKCPKCGRFARKIEAAEATPAKPAGSFCEACRWHSEQKIGIFEIISVDLWELVKAAPTNPTVRAQLLAKCLVAVPEEHKDAESIKNWIEFNVSRKTPKPSLGVPFPPSEPVVQVVARISETETGRCCYSVSRSCRFNLELSAEQVSQIARDMIVRHKDLECLGEELARHFEDALDCTDTDNYGDYDYQDHESDDTSCDDRNVRVNWNELANDFEAWIRNNQPELYRQLRNIE